MIELEEKIKTVQLGVGRTVRKAYGFDDISLVPGDCTLDIELCDTSWHLGNFELKTPIIASAMDSVVSIRSAQQLSALGALPVLNLQGINTRYQNPEDITEKIARSAKEDFVPLMQELYSQPIEPALIIQRIQELKQNTEIAAVSTTPSFAMEYHQYIIDAGCDILFVQSTVTSTNHVSKDGSSSLDLQAFCHDMPMAVVIGNCVTYKVAMSLMEAGAAGILVGIGPGAACTSRGVLGIGVPMATSIADCASARNDFYRSTGKYVPIIADGGMVVGGDICKAIACGADATMIGSPLARAFEAPGKGFHWGMATPSPILPRGTRIHVGTSGNLQDILHGPAKIDDGSQNLIGALKTCMSTVGARTIQEMHSVEIIIAESILTEGKVYQIAQGLGMGK